MRSKRRAKSVDTIGQLTIQTRCDLSVPQFFDGHDERRLADEPQFAVDGCGQLLERRQTVARPRLVDLLSHVLGGRRIDEITYIDQFSRRFGASIPTVQRVESRERRDGLPVLAGTCTCDPLGGLAVESVAACRNHETRGQSLHVPFERPRIGFVEVVDVERQFALGRGVQPEIGQMRVATQLHGQT